MLRKQEKKESRLTGDSIALQKQVQRETNQSAVCLTRDAPFFRLIASLSLEAVVKQ